MNILLLPIVAAMSSAAFAVLYNVERRQLPAAALCGALGYLVFVLLSVADGPSLEKEAFPVFVASAAMALYAELAARKLKAPATVFLASGLIPLVPGGDIFRSVQSAMAGEGDAALFYGFRALLIAAALAAGIILVTSLVRAYRGWRSHKEEIGEREDKRP